MGYMSTYQCQHQNVCIFANAWCHLTWDLTSWTCVMPHSTKSEWKHKHRIVRTKQSRTRGWKTLLPEVVICSGRLNHRTCPYVPYKKHAAPHIQWDPYIYYMLPLQSYNWWFTGKATPLLSLLLPTLLQSCGKFEALIQWLKRYLIWHVTLKDRKGDQRGVNESLKFLLKIFSHCPKIISSTNKIPEVKIPRPTHDKSTKRILSKVETQRKTVRYSTMDCPLQYHGLSAVKKSETRTS